MDFPIARSTLRRVTGVPDHLQGGLVALLATQTDYLLLSTSPLGQAYLTRAVLLLRFRFYIRHIPLWGVRYTPHRVAICFLGLVVVFVLPPGRIAAQLAFKISC